LQTHSRSSVRMLILSMSFSRLTGPGPPREQVAS